MVKDLRRGRKDNDTFLPFIREGPWPRLNDEIFTMTSTEEDNDVGL